jgi:hypothetical protein
MKPSLSEVMKKLGTSKSDAKIASSLANLEKANRARKLIFAMARRRKAKCKDMKVVLEKNGIINKGE